MTPAPGEVYLVDLGVVAKERPMVVVSRLDSDAPRALSVGVPFTTQNRASAYEVQIGKCSFLRETSWANVQGTVAVGHEKLLRRLGVLSPAQLLSVKAALRYLFDL
jgi:mRNA interferase MazF